MVPEDYLQLAFLRPTAQPFPRILPQMVIPEQANIKHFFEALVRYLSLRSDACILWKSFCNIDRVKMEILGSTYLSQVLPVRDAGKP